MLNIARRLLRSIRRRLLPSGAREDYEAWLLRHARDPAGAPGPSSRKRKFSILTSVFNTPPEYFRQAAASVFSQTHDEYEWIVLDNGSSKRETTEAVRAVSADKRVKIDRVDDNAGVIGGMRLCLAQAAGEYVVPLDSDDLLHPDALKVLNGVIGEENPPAFLYSDEDMFGPEGSIAAYCRPNWDPILNLCTSYIFHACAFDRKIGVSLGVYSDDASNYCHDWDTVFRFSRAGHEPVHVPAVLYRWRSHKDSSTNRPDPHSGSMASQRHLLESQLAAFPNPDLYSIEIFPVSRGAPEWWIRRKRLKPDPVQAVLLGRAGESSGQAAADLIGAASHPFSRLHIVGGLPLSGEKEGEIERQMARTLEHYGIPTPAGPLVQTHENEGMAGLLEAGRRLDDALTLVISTDLRMEGDEWPWEADLIRALHPEACLISTRILDSNRRVLAGNEVLGFDGPVGCPDAGRSADDPGYFGLALKRHSVSAVHAACFLGAGGFLREAFAKLPASAGIEFLGAWLGAIAAADDRRVAFTPMISAVARPGFDVSRIPSSGEMNAFASSYPALTRDRRWYSPHFGNTPATAYSIIQ